MNVIITVDTEEDNQWQRPWPSTVKNLEFLPHFQALCNRYALKVTYLCNYAVVNSSGFEFLRSCQEEGTAEIGAHMHPWANPPFVEKSSENRYTCPYPSELPLPAFIEKLRVLTEAIQRRTGRQPESYRAGRWGFCGEHIPPLSGAGYKVDSSVTPFISWQSNGGIKGGGPDFRQAPQYPYFPSMQDASQTGTADLLEVPMTIIFRNGIVRRNVLLRNLVLRHQHNLAARVISQRFHIAPKWFRPLPNDNAKSLGRVYDAAQRQGLPAAVLMCHSSELMPGGSPYFPTAKSVDRLYETLEGLFKLISAREGKGVTLGEFGRNHRQKPPSEIRAGTPGPI